MACWQEFAMTADDFLIGYAQLIHPAPPVQLFCVGHAAELYLKAARLKLDTNIDITKMSHRVGDMISGLQAREPSLLTAYALREAVYKKFIGRLVPMAEISDPDYKHYIRHQELYFVSRYLADIKYMGTAHKVMPITFSIMVAPCNPYWLPFFRELRCFLGWPIQGMWFDYIDRYLKDHRQDSQTRRFLGGLNA